MFKGDPLRDLPWQRRWELRGRLVVGQAMDDPDEAALALDVISWQRRMLRWQVPLLVAVIATLWILEGWIPWGMLGPLGVFIGMSISLRRGAEANQAVVDASAQASTTTQ